jgi:hypothetical protein
MGKYYPTYVLVILPIIFILSGASELFSNLIGFGMAGGTNDFVMIVRMFFSPIMTMMIPIISIFLQQKMDLRFGYLVIISIVLTLINAPISLAFGSIQAIFIPTDYSFLWLANIAFYSQLYILGKLLYTIFKKSPQV